MGNKTKKLKTEKCYLLEFKCKEAKSGRRIVVAYDGHDALKIFMKDWEMKYKTGEVDIPTDKLQDISIQEWCGYCDMSGRY